MSAVGGLKVGVDAVKQGNADDSLINLEAVLACFLPLSLIFSLFLLCRSSGDDFGCISGDTV